MSEDRNLPIEPSRDQADQGGGLLGYASGAECIAACLRRIGDYRRAVEQMLTYEQSGGDGWRKGWEMLKAVYRE